MFSSDIAIRVEDLSKCYEIYDNPRDRLKQFVMPRINSIIGKTQKQYYREFWALKNVSFEIKKGETVGIIGRNGSGKSTLLQIVCGTLTPSSGRVETAGRIAALLELGSGFNPEFTGRENIYLNAAVLGLTVDEIENRFDDIVAFADIGQFIDQPVKTYSSGMAVRLAFAVQSQVDPDILIVDEALSVGDAKFQAKCFDRLRQLKERGTSILLVTHSSEQIVTHCSYAILMDNGIQLITGEPKKVVNRYLDLLFGKEATVGQPGPVLCRGSASEANIVNKYEYSLNVNEDVFSTHVGYNPHEYRWGDSGVTITDFYLTVNDDPYPSAVVTGSTVTLITAVRFNRDVLRPIFGITIKTKEGVTVYGANSETLNCSDFHELVHANSAVYIKTVFSCRLAAGDYFISLGVATKHGEEVTPHDRRYDSIHLQVRPNENFFGIADLESSITATKVIG